MNNANKTYTIALSNDFWGDETDGITFDGILSRLEKLLNNRQVIEAIVSIDEYSDDDARMTWACLAMDLTGLREMHRLYHLMHRQIDLGHDEILLNLVEKSGDIFAGSETKEVKFTGMSYKGMSNL